MVQLARSDRRDREELLAAVLKNSDEPRRYRATAAVALGWIATGAAEDKLLGQVANTSDTAFPELLRSLGRIGGPSALEAIDSMRLPEDHPGKTTAAYAAALIAHRLGLSGHEIPFPDQAELLEPPTKDARPLTFVASDVATAGEVLSDLGQHPYGIKCSNTVLTRVQCVGEINVICPNVEFLGNRAELLTRRKAIVALVATQSPETANYSASYVVLSRPSTAGAVNIMVHRSSGRVVLAGAAHISDGRLNFELRAIRRPGAWALLLRGSMADGNLEMSEALSSSAPENRRVPARAVLDSRRTSSLLH